ncbi:MAG: DnaB-like helicase C-terminal domain-containing protein [Smithella sp.]|jgi:replicative DNA helicase
MNTVEKVQAEKELEEYNGIDKLYKSSEALEFFKQFKYPLPVKSDIPALDNYLGGGFESEEIVIISGKSGEGKTTLTITLTYNLCGQDKKILWFPFEKGGRHFLGKFNDTIRPFPHFYLPINIQAHDTIWIEKKIIECRCKAEGLDAVFIDHLHYIVPPNPRQNMATQIGEVMRELVRMAQEYKFTLFLIAHAGKVESDRRATKDDIKDSSAIVQESDTVLMVEMIKEDSPNYEIRQKANPWEPDVPIKRSFLHIDKNRKTGLLGKIDVELVGARYCEYERKK